MAQVPVTKDLYVARDVVPHPGSAGFERSFGLPKRGSIQQYRRRLGDHGCLHVRGYPTHFEAHVDTWDPRGHPFAHWWHDIRGGRVSLPASALLAVSAVWWLFR